MSDRTNRTDQLLPESVKREAIQRMKLADDTFFCATCKRFPEVAEYILQRLLKIPDLVVKHVETQSDERSLINRSVTLDVVAEDSTGKVYNIEVENTDNRAMPERARYHSAVLDSGRLKKNQDFSKLPETYVLFITKGDPLKTGMQISQIERVIMGTDRLFGDRAHIIYASMKYFDDSPQGDVLHDFLCSDPKDMKCSLLAEKADYFKNNEKGVSEMCEIMTKLNEMAIKAEKKELASDMVKAGKLNEEEISHFFGFSQAEAAQIYADNRPF